MLELPQTSAARTGQAERRLVERILRLWTEAAAQQRFPRPDEVDPWIVGDDWADCVLIAVQTPVERSPSVAVGKTLAVALCAKDTLAGVLRSNLPQVVSARRCLIIEGGATLRGVPILYRGGLFPLSDDGVTIDHVLGAVNHRSLGSDEPVTKLIAKRGI